MFSDWLPEAMGKQAKEEVMEEVVVVLEGDEEDVEGEGREAEQGGEVHPSGGTDTSLAAAALPWRSSIPSGMLSRSPRVEPSPPRPP